MSRVSFTAFYPSRPFWAVSAVNFQAPKVDDWFHDQMVEEVYSVETTDFALRVCRDGRILLRIPGLEKDDSLSSSFALEETVRRWGQYLDFLNAFYLLLDSTVYEFGLRRPDGVVARWGYFNLHEITQRDAFRVSYENGKASGENIALESLASVFQMARYSSSYPPGRPIELDPLIAIRHVISHDAIVRAVSLFEKVFASSGSEKDLASFAKSLAEYKVGNYETSLILAWFVTEATISNLWRSYIDRQDRERGNGRKRVNRERRDFLTGRDFPVSVVANTLELVGVIDHDLFTNIETVRRHRNGIVHSLRKASLGSSEAELAMDTARTMIERRWGIRFTPNLGYSVHGL
jgi:hypothetical protein